MNNDQINPTPTEVSAGFNNSMSFRITITNLFSILFGLTALGLIVILLLARSTYPGLIILMYVLIRACCNIVMIARIPYKTFYDLANNTIRTTSLFGRNTVQLNSLSTVKMVWAVHAYVGLATNYNIKVLKLLDEQGHSCTLELFSLAGPNRETIINAVKQGLHKAAIDMTELSLPASEILYQD